MNFAQSKTVVDMPLESVIVFCIIELIWSLGVALICYEFTTGRTGLINKLLSTLSHLTFCIYLMPVLSTYSVHHS
jgi:hypothetical protein